MEGIYSIYNYLILLGCSQWILQKYRFNVGFRKRVHHYMARSWDKSYLSRIEKEAVKWK